MPSFSSQKPILVRPHIIVMSIAVPSTIATSMTWPLPERCASRMPHTTPNAMNMPPPPKSPTMLIGGVGLPPSRPKCASAPAERDVVDVVARGLRHRAVLAPAGHAAVDELRVPGEAVVGTEPEPLGDAGAVALDQRVGLLDEPQHRLDAVGVLQVDADRAPAPVQRLEVRLVERRGVDLLGAVDPDDVGAHVGEQHPRERPRADPGQLDDLDALQRSHDALPPRVEKTSGAPYS